MKRYWELVDALEPQMREKYLNLIDMERYNRKTEPSTDGIECTECGNKMYIKTETGIVKCPKCYAKRMAKRYAEKSGMGNLLKNRIEMFKTPSDAQKAFKVKAEKYIRSIPTDKWFTALGASGSGKTMMCSIVGNAWIEHGVETRYVTWGDLLSINRQREYDQTIVDEYKVVPVLVLDDVAKVRMNETEERILFDLINYRYNANLVTILSSELTFEELLNIDTAIASRMKEKSGEYWTELKNINYRLGG